MRDSSLRGVSADATGLRSREDQVTVQQLGAEGFRGTIAATARFDDEVQMLRDLGADFVSRSFADTGAAFAAATLRAAGPEGLTAAGPEGAGGSSRAEASGPAGPDQRSS